MKSLIRTMLVLSCALTVCIATQVEAKSKHKEQKELHRKEKAERREQRHKDKAERKENRKHKHDPVVVLPPVVTPAVENPPVVLEQPIVDSVKVELPAPVGERASK